MTYQVKNEKLNQWVRESAELCEPEAIYWCDGSKEEYDRLMAQMVASGSATPPDQAPSQLPVPLRLPTSPGWRTAPSSRPNGDDAGPTNNWIQVDELKETMRGLYRGCMRGRTMYVIPFLMGLRLTHVQNWGRDY